MALIKKVWALIKLLKAGSYDKMTEAILPVILENKIVAPVLEKNKTVIGFLLTVAYYAAETGIVVFPAVPWLPPLLLTLGVIMTALGIAHRGVKERSGE